MVEISFKYDTSLRTTGMLATLASNTVRQKLKNSAKPCYFPYKMAKNCAKTNVSTICLDNSSATLGTEF